MELRSFGRQGGGFVPATIVLVVLASLTTATPALSADKPAGPATTTQPTTELAAEYQRRLDALAADDVEGHYALAEWCNRQQAYELCLRQTLRVLKLDPKHVNARLLNTIATRNLKERRRADLVGEGKTATGARVPLISKADIQKLRFAELLDYSPAVPDRSPPREPAPRKKDSLPPSGTRLPPRESVTVRFDKGLLTDFLDAMGDDPAFEGKDNRRLFFGLTPTQQVQVIRQYSGDTFANRIEIMSDPVVFRRFKQVLPVIERGCATIDCHGGDAPAKPFGLRPVPSLPDQSLYTQFLILDRVAQGRDRLIDRDIPENSLILQYGLPARSARMTHPTEIKPVYPQGTNDPNYRLVADWLDLLRVQRPRTGIVLEGYPEPPPPGVKLGGGTVAKQQAPQPPPTAGSPPGGPGTLAVPKP